MGQRPILIYPLSPSQEQACASSISARQAVPLAGSPAIEGIGSPGLVAGREPE